jgi:hypothetical protein
MVMTWAASPPSDHETNSSPPCTSGAESDRDVLMGIVAVNGVV